MDTKERHIRENESRERHEERVAREKDPRADLVADSLRAEAKDNSRNSTKRVNRLWLWLGVLILVAILIWWLFTYCIGMDATGAANGM